MSNWKPKDFAKYTLYRIYYGNTLVYLGRTTQPLQNRIRGHLFKKPMMRELFIDQITKIEYATFKTQADMYLYEIYFINLWHPPLNKDDKAKDELTVTLPEVEWKLFETPLWDKWKEEIHNKDNEEEKVRKRKATKAKEIVKLKEKRRKGEITEEVYWNVVDALENEKQTEPTYFL